ncbi:hypothetical protein LCGC14_0674290 [marine sediment metagenome]|uniref:Uncharacterized protein n=1 Tax=marine sediment metagenome TaxID=412755 RepID=A0A0F9RAH1_9ZZZZ
MDKFPETLRAADGGALLSWAPGAKVVSLYAGGTNGPDVIREWIRWLEDALAEIDPPDLTSPPDPSPDYFRCPECDMHFFHMPNCPIRIESGDEAHGLKRNW